ncbi:hypothetical protein E1A91_A07G015200v1 [Gossypium mustelinum]|uniref:RING-type domain-containing protein n=1 Tax=Gossypium mustelinum TaxID=34275 RepID=A0A5D2YET6_GOSMU|nr:hypothetical protein E1A91_A07G015200v1 [Gossypium mustelinum]
MSNDYINVQRRPLMEFLTCPLCSNIYREATTICVCLHTFCRQCIYEKVEKEKTHYCPTCDAYLGSIPQHMLRNDHKLEKLVMQIFPVEKPNEDNTKNRFSNHSMNPIMKQNELDNSEPTGREFSLERARKGLCWEHLGGHKDGETFGTEVQVKRRRRTQRKPYCKFLIGQREEGLKIGTANEMSKTDTSGLEKSTDSLNRCGEIVYLNQDSSCSPRPVWFCLLASQETNDMALPQIPKPFISTKNGDLAISIVNKYLAMKLNLKHESEVEVMCLGHPLMPTLTLNNLIDTWLEAVSDIEPVPAEEGDGRNFLMELTYRRSMKQCALQ